MSRLTREIISRTTLGLVALALLYGSFACISTSIRWRQEWREQHPTDYRSGRRDLSGAGYPMIMGILLVPVGMFVLSTAVLPTPWLLRVFRLNTTLHENPSMDNPRGPWR